MSRIDISVAKRATGEIIANRGFCRTHHLEELKEWSGEPWVASVCDRLMTGEELTAEVSSRFLQEAGRFITLLETALSNRKEEVPDCFDALLKDLTDGYDYIRQLMEKPEFSSLVVAIL